MSKNYRFRRDEFQDIDNDLLKCYANDVLEIYANDHLEDVYGMMEIMTNFVLRHLKKVIRIGIEHVYYSICLDLEADV